MTVTHDVQLAMSADFLRAFARLPKQQQKKTRTWIDKFRANPDAAARDYESLHSMRDPKVRTSRIDKKYRAVLVHPEEGNVCLLVWVDNHDEAADWARNKVFEVNRYTGTFQVYEPQHNAQAAPPAEATPVETVVEAQDWIPAGFLLGGHLIEDLLLFGVPEPLVPAVRALRTPADLDALSGYLPQEASDAVYMLSSGYSVEEVMDELDRKERSLEEAQEQVDPADVVAALRRSSTRRQFKLVEDDEELSEMLAAPMEQWRVFLHPSQRKLVRMRSKGSARVLGGAGTGKTVVAMHRIRYLAREVFTEPGQRLLFTTFTANLAADIRGHLERLCGSEFERIEVKHLQQVARDVLSGRGARLPARARDAQIRSAWSEAFSSTDLDFSEVFYREEWDRVVQAQDVSSLEEYLKAKRAGRGQRLSRRQRNDCWQVFAAYRDALTAKGYCEMADTIREARFALENGDPPYAAVVADEVQDFRTADVRLLRALVAESPNDIFVVGDPHQRIYGHHASLARCGVSVRGRRSRKLRVNYRTTQEIRNWAVARLEGLEFDDLDEGKDDLRGERSLRLGVAPRVRMFATEADEARFLVNTVRAWVDEDACRPEDICVCARTNKLAENYRGLLEAEGVLAAMIKRSETKRGKGVRVATMHRVKGLEFSRMALAGVNADTLPFRDAQFHSRDETSRELYERGERQLLYVLATRARDEFIALGSGEVSPLVGSG